MNLSKFKSFSRQPKKFKVLEKSDKRLKDKKSVVELSTWKPKDEQNLTFFLPQNTHTLHSLKFLKVAIIWKVTKMAVSIASHSAPKNREMFAIKKSYSIEVGSGGELVKRWWSWREFFGSYDGSWILNFCRKFGLVENGEVKLKLKKISKSGIQRFAEKSKLWRNF